MVKTDFFESFSDNNAVKFLVLNKGLVVASFRESIVVAIEFSSFPSRTSSASSSLDSNNVVSSDWAERTTDTKLVNNW